MTLENDEDLKKEFDEIQEEIATEKGQKKDLEKEEEHESAGDEDVDDSSEDEEESDDTPTDEDEEEIEPSKPSKDDRKVPLSKYQDTKKTLETTVNDLQSKVESLTNELNQAKTAKTVGEKVKSFAEKHGMAEDAVLDLVQLVRGEAELDKPTKDIIEKSAQNILKQEAEDKLNQELEDFFVENPDARSHETSLRQKALEKGNLNKSLFEVYHRFIKTEDAPARKKTGESSRVTHRQSSQTFDVKKVMEKVKSGNAKPFEGLTNEQVDAVFNQMEKEGSRYQ